MRWWEKPPPSTLACSFRFSRRGGGDVATAASEPARGVVSRVQIMPDRIALETAADLECTWSLS